MSHLYAAQDQGYITGDQFKRLHSRAEICSKQLAGLITFLLGRKDGNQKGETLQTPQTQKTQ